MGQIIFKSDLIFNKLNSNLISDLQKKIINSIVLFFSNIEIDNINIDSESSIGAHGEYESKETYLVKTNIRIDDFIIDFYIDYDQIEYYVTSNEKIIVRCVLERYFEDKIMAEKFNTYLKNDLKKIQIPYNLTNLE